MQGRIAAVAPHEAAAPIAISLPNPAPRLSTTQFAPLQTALKLAPLASAATRLLTAGPVQVYPVEFSDPFKVMLWRAVACAAAKNAVHALHCCAVVDTALVNVWE
jgi:hypothetical protein